MQVDPIKPTLKAPGSKRLKLEDEKMLSNFAFKFHLRRYTWDGLGATRLAFDKFGSMLAYTKCEVQTSGRGLHSSTFQLNLSALYGTGGARRGCVAVA